MNSGLPEVIVVLSMFSRQLLSIFALYLEVVNEAGVSSLKKIETSRSSSAAVDFNSVEYAEWI